MPGLQLQFSEQGQVPDSYSHAYCKLQLEGTALKLPDELSHNTHLRTLVLREAGLTDLEGVGNLKHLTCLDISRNEVTRMLDIKPPLTSLQSAYFAQNGVRELSFPAELPLLRTLVLDENQLETLPELHAVAGLTSLSLRGNSLGSATGLHMLTALRCLDISSNKLTSLLPLRGLQRLENLHAAHNCLSALEGIDQLSALRSCDIAYNALPALEALAGLQACSELRSLGLPGNPLTKVADSRLHTIKLLPQLTQLSGRPVTSEERVDVSVLYADNADELRATRRTILAAEELPDGGGALLLPAIDPKPPADVEELRRTDFSVIDAHVAAMPSEAAGSWDLEQVAGYLARGASAGGSNSTLELVRACWLWVASMAALPAGCGLANVNAPLLPPQTAGWEALLLGEDTTGTWAERAVALFVRLAAACALEARSVLGWWKSPALAPGTRLAVHNHCWAAVHSGQGWCLLDVACDATGLWPRQFVTPPEAFIYSHLPLQSFWQLLEAPLSKDAFWDLPQCNEVFFKEGLRLKSDVKAVNVLSAEPQRDSPDLEWPTLQITLAVPPGVHIRHQLLDRDMQPAGTVAQDEGCCFQQRRSIVGSNGGSHNRREKAEDEEELWTAFPGSGEWYVKVSVVHTIWLSASIDGLVGPLRLAIEEVQDVMQTKVLVQEPPPTPPTASPADHAQGTDGSELGGAASEPPAQVWLPRALPVFRKMGCWLLDPCPGRTLAQGMMERFSLVAPDADSVLLKTADGSEVVGELSKQEESGTTFTGELSLPRTSCGFVTVVATGGYQEEALLSFALRPAVLQICPCNEAVVYDELELERQIDLFPELAATKEAFMAVDADSDGFITRKELLLAMRKNPQISRTLRITPKTVREADGTLAAFHKAFLAINTDKLGKISWQQMAAHLGYPRPESS